MATEVNPALGTIDAVIYSPNSRYNLILKRESKVESPCRHNIIILWSVVQKCAKVTDFE